MEYKTDSLLVHLARAGDEDACEKLVKKYYSSIYQYCLLHINDPYILYLKLSAGMVQLFRISTKGCKKCILHPHVREC